MTFGLKSTQLYHNNRIESLHSENYDFGNRTLISMKKKNNFSQLEAKKPVGTSFFKKINVIF